MNTSLRRGAAGWLVAGCGVWDIGLGLYFLFLRPPLLPEDLRYIATNLSGVHAVAPGLERWLMLVFMVNGGFMVGTGVLIVFLAWAAMPRQLPGTTLVLIVVGFCTVVLMSAVNFVLQSDFRFLLVGPLIVWAFAVLLYIRTPH